MDAYHIAGWVSSVFFVLSLVGILDQILKLHRRRRRFRLNPSGESVTAVLSLNQFLCHFLGVYAFFVYGFLIERFNPYLVWPRLAATLLVLVILFQIMADRRNLASQLVFGGCLAATAGALLLLASGYRIGTVGAHAAQALVVAVFAIGAQGYLHQLAAIRRSGTTGAISLPMNVLIVLKDASSFALGLTMGLADGWPVMLQNGTNGLFRLSIVSQFYLLRGRRGADGVATS
jgi:uncharacterized protein with PQ loop repeat